VVSRFLKT